MPPERWYYIKYWFKNKLRASGIIILIAIGIPFLLKIFLHPLPKNYPVNIIFLKGVKTNHLRAFYLYTKYHKNLAAHNELGKLGEQLAVNFLYANSYTILERNWRINRAEVDIIARKNNTLIFIEVKSRSTAYFGPPEVFVTKRKKRLLASAASAYMQESGHEWAIRFDIISVVMELGKPPVIEHFEDAFFPGLFE